jgi:hypothetical protein
VAESGLKVRRVSGAPFTLRCASSALRKPNPSFAERAAKVTRTALQNLQEAALNQVELVKHLLLHVVEGRPRATPDPRQ